MTTVRRTTSRGFTLIECLAAMLLMAIVLPSAMKAIAISSNSASSARYRTEAAGLAQAKLGELLATEQWQGGVLSGDFGTEWPNYRWDATVQQWANDTTSNGLQQIDLHVFWIERNQERVITLTTVTYPRSTTTQ